MTGHRGKALLLKISDGQNPPQYRTIAGLRTISESIGDEVSIKASGIFLGSEAENVARSRALDRTLHDYELSYEDGVKMHRRLLIQRLDYAGDYNGERNYTIQLESADGRAWNTRTAEAASQEREARLIAMTVDDPNWICEGIPYDVIEAGMDAQDKVRHDMDNYISGVTPDWDDGMVVAAIFKAMLRAALAHRSNEGEG